MKVCHHDKFHLAQISWCHGEPPSENDSFGDSERERKDTPIKNLPMTLILWLDGRRDRDVRYNTII